jgi:large subunit ribosomal protein L13
MRRNQALCFLALCAAGLAAWTGSEVFAGGSMLERPAGQFFISEKPPEGMTCMNAAKRGMDSGRGARHSPYAMIWQKNYEHGTGVMTEPEWFEDEKNREWMPTTKETGEETFRPTSAMQADVNRRWYHFDAEGKDLEHLAKEIALTLNGYNSVYYYDGEHDVGHFVIVTNCEKVRVSGTQFHYKLYFRNLSKRPGHTKVERFKDLQNRFPERVVMKEVWKRLRTNPQNRRIFKERLKLYTGPNHLHYDKDPIDFPMHKIQDVTSDDSVRFRDLPDTYYNQIAPRKALKRERVQRTFDEMQLKAFKRFLKSQYEDESAEGLERMELDELVQKAESERQIKVRNEGKGLRIQKQPPEYYPGTRIEVQPIRGGTGTDVKLSFEELGIEL